MSKYKLFAACGWIANSTIDFGEDDFDTIEEAQEAAWEQAAERVDAWVELVDETKE